MSAKVRNLATSFLHWIIRNYKPPGDNHIVDFSYPPAEGMKGSPSPFFTLSMRNFLMFGQMSEPQAYTKNLLALARHYDVPRDDELSQVTRKMGIGNNGDVLKVGTF
jgi:hypothetical protein